MADTQFDKDFGYLMPFLDKVATATSGLRDAAAREELTRIVAEEKQRWARVRQLLSRAEATKSSSTAASPTNVATSVDKPTNEESLRERPVFTVGSLRSRGADASQLKK